MKFKNRVRKALSERSRDESLTKRGVAGTAVVNSVKRSHVSKGDDDDASEPIYKYQLTVTVPGQEPYDVAHSETNHADEGQTVPVMVDPDDPENLLIDWRQAKAETTAKWQEATQANVARVQQMFAPAPMDANDSALEPIAGINLERYVELCVGRVKANIATEEQQDAWLKTQGVEPVAWKTASDGWGQRMVAHPNIAIQYATLYQSASA